jgi:SAM-dependent methyltransferase
MAVTAREAYEKLAPDYDAFTSENDYEMWLGGVLLPELEKHGLTKGRALDVGCGTGRAFDPLLDRGWAIVGCDLSPGMLEQARRKFGEAVPLSVADAAALPALGAFDLILCLNDTINYLTDDGELDRALAGMRANLGPGGLLLFDVNTLDTFRAEYSSPAGPGSVFETVVDAGIEPHLHRQRHFGDAEIRAALGRAGLTAIAVLGQAEVAGEVLLNPVPDEERDHKVVYIAGVSP